MNQILLDTSAYSNFMKGHLEIKLALREVDQIYLNPIILGELRAGFRKGHHRAKNEKELLTFLTSPRIKFVAIDEDTADRYAVIMNYLWKIGSPVPTNDIWIAASAMQHGLRILTSDAHFQKMSQVLVEYY